MGSWAVIDGGGDGVFVIRIRGGGIVWSGRRAAGRCPRSAASIMRGDQPRAPAWVAPLAAARERLKYTASEPLV